MGSGSAVGPIDPQIGFTTGKRFSADAFLEGLNKIKDEVQTTGKLNAAYIPILQNISPGEIQNCLNAREFSQALVREWLALQYKFKYWENHSKTGMPVTQEEKRKRAGEIAEALCDHSRWLTHNRSIRREDLENLGLRITNYADDPQLEDAIARHYTLLKMTFDLINAYKIFETPQTQVLRIMTQAIPSQPLRGANAQAAQVEHKCQCGNKIKIQMNLDKHSPLQLGHQPYPVATNILKCPKCGRDNNLMAIRLQVEAQTSKKVVQ